MLVTIPRKMIQCCEFCTIFSILNIVCWTQCTIQLYSLHEQQRYHFAEILRGIDFAVRVYNQTKRNICCICSELPRRGSTEKYIQLWIILMIARDTPYCTVKYQDI